MTSANEEEHYDVMSDLGLAGWFSESNLYDL